ncbi:CPBP family intramembrane glutamic endopeptidase [uncultured Chitinophaga sp.]|uniref:CPBP family intramembrane glutamic endopeptidase n=1 Tax=uncultured Chitinophaga sp. TaxID=339340 RepID=UPI0025F78652|nr:CPBP family intramembrane glutamic endopeptidase [uncultured Chitinophaga sp.]
MSKWNDKAVQFVLIWSSISVAINFAFVAAIWFVENVLHVVINKRGADDHGIWVEFILFCVIAPPVETYFFQKLFYDYFTGNGKSKVWLIILSSIIFGLFHFYSISYVIVAALNGVLFIYTYIIWQGHKISKYLIVTMIHAFHNLFFLLLEIISS